MNWSRLVSSFNFFHRLICREIHDNQERTVWERLSFKYHKKIYTTRLSSNRCSWPNDLIVYINVALLNITCICFLLLFLLSEFRPVYASWVSSHNNQITMKEQQKTVYIFVLLLLSASSYNALPIINQYHIRASHIHISRQTFVSKQALEKEQSSFEPVPSQFPLISGESDNVFQQEQSLLATLPTTQTLEPSETPQGKRKEVPPRALEVSLVPLCNTQMRNCIRRNRCDFNVRRSDRRRGSSSGSNRFCQSRCRTKAQACK